MRREQGSPFLDIHFLIHYTMQQILIHGNLTKDAELVTFGERQQVKFSVACNEGKGEKKVTTYYDVLSYSVGIQPYLLKGKDGKTYVNLNVYADGVELCGGRGDTQATVEPQVQYQAPKPAPIVNGNGELPF